MRLSVLLYCSIFLIRPAYSQKHGETQIKDTLKSTNSYRFSLDKDSSIQTAKAGFGVIKYRISQKIRNGRDSIKKGENVFVNRGDSLDEHLTIRMKHVRDSLNSKTKGTDSSVLKARWKRWVSKEKSNTKLTISSRKNRVEDILDSTTCDSMNQKIKAQSHKTKKHLKKELRQARLSIKKSLSNSVDSSFSLKKKLASAVTLSGSIRSESFATNYLLPFQPGERIYSRLCGNSNLTLLNLPFDAGFYLTTEKNTLYNANSFSLNFDPEQYRRNLEEQARRRIKEKTDEQGQYKARIKSQEAELKKLNRQYSSKLGSLNQKRDELYKLPSDYKNHYEMPYADSIKNQTRVPETSKLNNTMKPLDWNEYSVKGTRVNCKDSIKSSGVTDSLQNRREKQKYDSIMEDYRKTEEELKVLRKRMELLQQSIQTLKHADSLVVKELKKLADDQNPSSLITLMGKESNTKKTLEKGLSCITSFNIGIFNPAYTPNSLWGITVKGVNLAWDGPRSFGNLTLGNTYRDQLSFNGFATKRPDFDRRVYASMAGYGSRNGTNVYLVNMQVKDKPSNIPDIDQSKNTLGGAGGQIDFNQIALFKGEVLYSKYEKPTPSLYNEVPIYLGDSLAFNPRIRYVARTAINLSSTIFPMKNTEIKVGWKWVGPGFRSLGAPYARTNFDERDIALKCKFFKNKLAINGFYKTNRQDPLHYAPGDYKMSGFGINLRTAFRKYPNLYLSYSPFEQGNNSPDTLLRSNNRFSIMTGGLSYSYTLKKVNSFTNFLFTRSHTEFIQLQNRIGDQYLYSLSQSFRFERKLTLNLLYTASRTAPSVDSLNNDRIGSTLLLVVSPRLSASIQYDGSFYKNGSRMQQGGLRFDLTLKKNVLINLKFNAGKLDGLYGLAKIFRYEGLFGIEYRW